MSLPTDELSPGEKVRLVFDDDPTQSVDAVVTSFLSDAEEGLGPEIEDYVACWVEVKLRESAGKSVRRSLTLGTDSRYALDGRRVTIHKL